MGNFFSIQMGDRSMGRCWDHCGTQAAYMWQLEANIEDLQTTTRELRALKEDVERRVRVQEQQGMQRLAQVDLWLLSVDSAIVSAGELITYIEQQVHKLCLGGWCSKNCWSSYTFGRKVVKTHETLVSLKVKGEKFEAVTENAIAEEDLMAEMPCDPTVGLEKKLDEVWNYLFEDNVGMVGLYGIGGVGKTTLLKEIYNKFIDVSNNFLMIWVVVSQNFTLERIQDDIGQKMGISNEHWNGKSLVDKAQEIFNKLKNMKFALLLDDLWQRVNLIKIGVPPLEKLNGSKVIFTTRSMDVCGQMGAESRIGVEVLEWEQAWKLFRKNVGEETISIHPEIHPLAESVARKCGGLPLALITIGRAMFGKTDPREWHHATQILRTPALHLREVEDEVLSLLKFSYESLPSDKIKSCFLYCALFPYDFKIYKDKLVDFWICENFWIDCDDGIDARNEAYSIIGTLIRASLLEEWGKENVKMHDLIRDMALWITKENTLVMAGMQLNEAPKVGRWGGLSRLSLMENNIEKLTEVPTCPNLVTLFLHINRGLNEINDDFFQFMGSLTVLDLSRCAIKKLPRSISKLVSLQCIHIGMTQVQELPMELTELRKLKYLNLDKLDLKARKSEQLISNLSSLQVLKMRDCSYCYKGEEEEGDEEAYDGMLLQELQCLKHLKTLGITIRCTSTLHKLAISDNLLTKTGYITLQRLKGLKRLNLSLLGNIKNMNWLVVVGCVDLEEMHIDGCVEGIGALGGVYNSAVLKDRSFYRLREVGLVGCHQLLELTWLILVPNLTNLFVVDCHRMEEIISEEKLGEVIGMPQNLHPFSKLCLLSLVRLPRLKCIYQKPLPLPVLVKFEVNGCPGLKKLPFDSNSGNGCKIEFLAKKEWWEAIEWEDEATKVALLPRLRCILH